jgi:hypothetical protein
VHAVRDVTVDEAPHRSGHPSPDLVHEILLGVLQDQAGGRVSHPLGQEVSLRLDRLERAWTTTRSLPRSTAAHGIDDALGRRGPISSKTALSR